jgi:bis(5'-nucleosyl)-tetraphosphatase (symmetrical)
LATYAIGDIQGCYQELRELIDKLVFNPQKDTLWLLGDLINRGPENLAVVRYVMSLGSAACTVLGNHDLHFLAIALGGHRLNKSDTLTDILDAPDVDDIVEWYCQQPLLVKDEKLGFVMAHAGVPHLWSLDQAAELAAEVEMVIRGEGRTQYFRDMYGNEPARWSKRLTGMDRLRSITNYLTRMRLMKLDGTLDFAHKGALSDAPDDCVPWYQLRAEHPFELTTLFGHWAALEGETGCEGVLALDTGCVWGRDLTAYCLETGDYTRVAAANR